MRSSQSNIQTRSRGRIGVEGFGTAGREHTATAPAANAVERFGHGAPVVAATRPASKRCHDAQQAIPRLRGLAILWSSGRSLGTMSRRRRDDGWIDEGYADVLRERPRGVLLGPVALRCAARAKGRRIPIGQAGGLGGFRRRKGHGQCGALLRHAARKSERRKRYQQPSHWFTPMSARGRC